MLVSAWRQVNLATRYQLWQDRKRPFPGPAVTGTGHQIFLQAWNLAGGKYCLV